MEKLKNYLKKHNLGEGAIFCIPSYPFWFKIEGGTIYAKKLNEKDWKKVLDLKETI